jgi:MOSC domain-containing protein YiiM
VVACPDCAFDRAAYDRRDLLRTLTIVAPMWRMMTETTDAEVLTARPPGGAAADASVLELVAESCRVVASLAPSLRSEDPVSRATAGAPTMEGRLRELDETTAGVFSTNRHAEDARWAEIDLLVTDALHACIHLLRAGGRALHALGAGAPHQVGTLVQINSGGGGVPKASIPRATVDGRGVVDDVQDDRAHHGAPLQALCLWSADVMDALNTEGHSLFAGAAGENLTVRGIDWTTIRPGVRLTIGPVVAEVSAFAIPCAKNAQWFAAGDFRRMDHGLHPGWSRAYAWVLEGGEIEPGLDVVVE